MTASTGSICMLVAAWLHANYRREEGDGRDDGAEGLLVLEMGRDAKVVHVPEARCMYMGRRWEMAGGGGRWQEVVGDGRRWWEVGRDATTRRARVIDKDLREECMQSGRHQHAITGARTH